MPPIENPLSPIRSQISLIPLDNPEIFTENIEKVTTILKQAYEQKAYTAVHFAVIDLIKTIPLEKDFWSAITTAKPGIEKAINDMSILSELFFKSCYRIKDSSPLFREKQYALSKILFTQKKLGQHLSPSILLPFTCIDYNNSMESSGFPYIQGLDPVIARDFNSINN
jgi:hypothetical protein